MNQKLLSALKSFLNATGKTAFTTEYLNACFHCGGKEAAEIAFNFDRQHFSEEKVKEFEEDFAMWLLRNKCKNVSELPKLSSLFHRNINYYYENHPEYQHCIRNTPEPKDWAELGAIIIFRAIRAYMSEQYEQWEIDGYESGIADTIKINE